MLSSNQIKLRKLEPSDQQALAILANNKAIWNNLRDYIPHPYSENDAAFFIDLVKNEDPIVNFAIEFEGQLAGVMGLVLQKDVYRGTAEIGYWLGEAFWAKGIATEAVGLITKYGFETLQLRKIYAGVFAFNQDSMRVLEKNGYQKEAILKDSVIKNGKISDEHRYSILKNV
jgi:[ribosomal protein S5]-alanine N-acetyltransferase